MTELTDLKQRTIAAYEKMRDWEGEKNNLLGFLHHDDGREVYSAFVSQGGFKDPRRFASEHLRRHLCYSQVGVTKAPHGTIIELTEVPEKD